MKIVAHSKVQSLYPPKDLTDASTAPSMYTEIFEFNATCVCEGIDLVTLILCSQST